MKKPQKPQTHEKATKAKSRKATRREKILKKTGKKGPPFFISTFDSRGCKGIVKRAQGEPGQTAGLALVTKIFYTLWHFGTQPAAVFRMVRNFWNIWLGPTRRPGLAASRRKT